MYPHEHVLLRPRSHRTQGQRVFARRLESEMHRDRSLRIPWVASRMRHATRAILSATKFMVSSVIFSAGQVALIFLIFIIATITLCPVRIASTAPSMRANGPERLSADFTI
jgi:hypothetical protein